MVAKKFKPNPQWVADGVFKLPGLEYWRWRALDAELARQSLEQELARRDLEEAIKSNPAMSTMRQRRAAAYAAWTETSKLMKSFQEQITANTGLDPAQCAIDDVTGEIKATD